MLPKFEEHMAGLNVGDTFDFVIACADAYGDYDERGVMKLDKKMFFNGDGEFDKEHVFVGNIVPRRYLLTVRQLHTLLSHGQPRSESQDVFTLQYFPSSVLQFRIIHSAIEVVRRQQVHYVGM